MWDTTAVLFAISVNGERVAKTELDSKRANKLEKIYNFLSAIITHQTLNFNNIMI
jgi:hypothetical protein